ncbi:cytochrome c [Myxococcota bacterium]|nr:cytochrome c [Myxococcota bacterium]
MGECACGLSDDDDLNEDDVDESVDEGDHTGWTGEVVGDAERGATIYASSCAACHGATGLGTASGPSLADEVAEESDEGLAETIRAGEDGMPPFPNLSEQDLADLIAWLRARFGGSSEGEEEQEEDDD